MSLLSLLWLIAAFTACGIGAWLTMAGIILGGVASQMIVQASALRFHILVSAILTGLGFLLFVVGTAMIARVLG